MIAQETSAGGKGEDKEAVKAKEEEDQKSESPKKTDKVESSPDFSTLSNPARVLPQQWKVVSLEEECRYKPIKSVCWHDLFI